MAQYMVKYGTPVFIGQAHFAHMVPQSVAPLLSKSAIPFSISWIVTTDKNSLSSPIHALQPGEKHRGSRVPLEYFTAKESPEIGHQSRALGFSRLNSPSSDQIQALGTDVEKIST